MLDEQSIPSFLKLIDPKLKYQRKLAERVELIDAIHEIATAEEDTRWLEEEYRYIHEHADELRKEHAKAPQALAIFDRGRRRLLRGRHEGSGIDGRPQLEKLDQLLLAASYDLEKLMAFFSPVKKVPSRDGLNSPGDLMPVCAPFFFASMACTPGLFRCVCTAIVTPPFCPP